MAVPDELVRGVSIVGTPLAAMKRILATGDKSEVFNGECGAESGTVPVSAVAPAMLVSEMETQRQPQGTARPPILAIPGADQGSGAGISERTAQCNPMRSRRRNEPESMDSFAGLRLELSAACRVVPGRSRPAPMPRRIRC